MAQFDSKGSSKPIPTIQFASICDHLGIDVESSHDQILRTFRSYYTYLKSYIEIQKNKNAAFRVESVSSIKVYLNEPSSRIWKVIPKTVITVDDSNYGWYYCPDLEDDLEEGDVINGGEYMVIRSRVKCDEHGNIVSANYSKILGPMGLFGMVGLKEAVFNPRPNDTNLEFDPKRNLYQGKKGRGMIP